MGNSLFNELGGQLANQTPLPGPLQNMQDFMQMFSSFRNNFRGDPKAIVEEKLNSGEISPQQFEMLKGWAQQIQNGMRR